MDFLIETNIGEMVYNTDPCSLTMPDGKLVDLSAFAFKYGQSFVDDGVDFSPEKPLVGKVQPRILKVQLGLGCNMHCSYCSQSGQKEEGSSVADAESFLDNLGWLEKAPEKIEFWGGEPLLYWKKLETLAGQLRVKFPHTKMSLVTNGTLLSVDRAQRLFDLGFTLAVSHDGPGQSLRGEDPFNDPGWVTMVREVFKLFGDRITFNAVITPLNIDIFETWMWFEERMGFTVKVNIEDVVTDYGNAKWTEGQLKQLSESIKKHVSSGLALAFPRLRWSAQQFMESLANAKTLKHSHQVCGMDRRDQLAVDLHGNVLTCQNVGVNSGHKIGSMDKLDEVSLNTSRSWASRPNCHKCAVVHLCYGSCMFLNDADFESSCRSSHRYNSAILEGIIKLVTGATVKSISGWKPRKFIPIEVAQ